MSGKILSIGEEWIFVDLSGKSEGRIGAAELKDAEGKVGGAIKVAGFVRYTLGEGIDRPDGDFAAEVAAAAGR